MESDKISNALRCLSEYAKCSFLSLSDEVTNEGKHQAILYI